MEKNNLEFDLKNDDVLYFLHIPKTAGTTLMAILEEHFDYNSILQAHDWHTLFENMPKNFSKIRFTRGHFGYGFHQCFPKTPICITMLRDPMNQIISMYNQMRQNAAKLGKSKYQKMGLLEMINTTKKKNIFSKHQTRHLALDLDITSLTKNYSVAEKKSFYLERTNEFLFPKFSDEKLLEIAKDRLSTSPFFGLVERFEDSLNLLCYVFGWRPIQFAKKRNVTPDSYKKNLDEDTVSTISTCIQVDNKLYQFAKTLFDERFNQMVSDLKIKFNQFSTEHESSGESLFHLLELNYDLRSKNRKVLLKNSIDYNFIEKISGTGWYYRQVMENKELGLRWTGPSFESSIDFPIKREKDLVIQFCLKPLKKNLLKKLQFHVENQKIDFKIINQVDDKFTFEGYIPKLNTNLEKNYTRLIFSIEKTYSPNSFISLSKDSRKLGLAFYWIKISPEILIK